MHRNASAAVGPQCTVRLSRPANGTSNLSVGGLRLYDVSGVLIPSDKLALVTSSLAAGSVAGNCIDSSQASLCSTDAAIDFATADMTSSITVGDWGMTGCVGDWVGDWGVGEWCVCV